MHPTALKRCALAAGLLAWPLAAEAQTPPSTGATPAPVQQAVPPVQQAPDTVLPAPVGPAAVDISAAIKRAQEAASAGRSTEALDALDEAAVTIWERMPLTVRRATLVAEEPQGYGVFNPRDSSSFDAGQPLLVYVELNGQGWRRSGDLFRTDLVLDFELRTKDGQALVAQQAFNTIATASRRRNREFFVYVTYSFSGVEPGDYVVRTTVRDRAGSKQTSFDLSFTVKP
ncbi:hypothetical protein [Phreatobacter stygius]|uniref:Uncharacterized protein n=1 Tax=Phreatobacter stygius TaxID=1940610 RepID=A0A4D7B3I9_9HYPH|nr:hypothetical protein [Phreatobacter stygius]QCI65603.1 hypothetical protein E8M01_16140 [Phreatobacter stygius]